MPDTTQNFLGPKTRFHALDALRAWAMSLGIVLHAAWIMIPESAGAPRIDASANWTMAYVCLAIHAFRMQLFFLLAGFFACLLLGRRGMRRFLQNRAMRILLPLTAFWIILCPLITYQYNVAGIQSGRILSDRSAIELTHQFLVHMGLHRTMLMHLWFLYYLAWIYVLVLLGRTLIAAVDRQAVLRRRASDGFIAVASARWSVLGLAVPFAIPLFLQGGAWGIEIRLTSFVPKATGLIAYLMFFVAGWLLYQRAEALPRITRPWRSYLVLGTLLTVPFYIYTRTAPKWGYATWKYPELTIEDLRHVGQRPDFTSFRNQLLEAEPESVAGRVFETLPPDTARFVKTHADATEDQLSGVLAAINRHVIADPDVFRGIAEPMPVPTADTRRQNRLQIEAAFGGTIHPDAQTRPFYYAQRLAFAYFFTLTSWSLILGCLGFSQHFFDRGSRFWRYYSDASYWFYLAHLPIQFQLLIWFGDQPWHPLLKFSFYVLTTIGVLVPSYHLLIRPTWIGYFLNGRMASVWPKPRPSTTQPPIAQPAPLPNPPLSETTSLDL